MKREREFGPDLVRASAVVLVLAVHFFLNTDFYSVSIRAASMVPAVFLRMACMTCVPLFLLLTGYLCVDRPWGQGYYRKLLPILLTYLLAGILCIAYRFLIGGESYPAFTVVMMFLEYSAAPYAWYVEMYIGLFLLSPFLNILWRGLEERGKRALLITMLILSALPALLNFYYKLLPDFWVDCYPLAYYFLGAWLKEHPIRVRGWVLGLGFAGGAAVLTAAEYILVAAAGAMLGWNGIFTAGNWANWGSLLVMWETVCLFALLVRRGGERAPGPVRWCVRQLARLSLPMYLLSYITDQIFYPRLKAMVPEMPARLPWMPVMVLLGVACSALLAAPVEWAVRALMRLIPRGAKNVREERK